MVMCTFMSDNMDSNKERDTTFEVLFCFLAVVIVVLKYFCLTSCGRSQRASLDDPEVPRVRALSHFKYHALPLVPPPLSFDK